MKKKFLFLFVVVFTFFAYTQEMHEYDLEQYTTVKDCKGIWLWEEDAVWKVRERYGNLHIKYKIIKSINILNVSDAYYYEHFIDDIEYFYNDKSGEHFLGKVNMVGIYDCNGNMIYDVLEDMKHLATKWKIPMEDFFGYNLDRIIYHPFFLACGTYEKYIYPNRVTNPNKLHTLDNFAEIYIDFEKNSLAVKPILF